jgi:hypothetical protein
VGAQLTQFSPFLLVPLLETSGDKLKMRLSSIFAGVALLSASSSQALNILLNNDDGFGSANLRETYRLLKGKGHNGKTRS